MKRLTFLLFCLLLGIGMANAQTTKVTGTVISAKFCKDSGSFFCGYEISGNRHQTDITCCVGSR